MANPTSSYVKKFKDGAVNQVVNDLQSGMVVMEQQEKAWVDGSKIDGAIKWWFFLLLWLRLINGGSPFTCPCIPCNEHEICNGILSHGCILHQIFNHLSIHGNILWSPGNTWNRMWLRWFFPLYAFTCPWISCNICDSHIGIIACSSILRCISYIDMLGCIIHCHVIITTLVPCILQKMRWCRQTKSHW